MQSYDVQQKSSALRDQIIANCEFLYADEAPLQLLMGEDDYSTVFYLVSTLKNKIISTWSGTKSVATGGFEQGLRSAAKDTQKLVTDVLNKGEVPRENTAREDEIAQLKRRVTELECALNSRTPVPEDQSTQALASALHHTLQFQGSSTAESEDGIATPATTVFATETPNALNAPPWDWTFRSQRSVSFGDLQKLSPAQLIRLDAGLRDLLHLALDGFAVHLQWLDLYDETKVGPLGEQVIRNLKKLLEELRVDCDHWDHSSTQYSYDNLKQGFQGEFVGTYDTYGGKICALDKFLYDVGTNQVFATPQNPKAQERVWKIQRAVAVICDLCYWRGISGEVGSWPGMKK